MGTSIVYVPRRIAPSPSPLRITAYRDGSQLLGPEIDLEGWSILQSIELSGTLFGTKAVKVQAMVRYIPNKYWRYLIYRIHSSQ